METKEIFEILKKAANFELEKKDYGWHGFGSINRCHECDTMSSYEYLHSHYPKMVALLESLPWEKTIKNPYNPQPEEYPTEDGVYITMMDCNEHEVCTNTFHDGHFSWMNRTHIKWWMKLPNIE